MNRKKSDEPFDFEAGMHRLEEIIALFDQGGLPLVKMETYFVEGMELVRKCSERLDQVETRITELLHDPKTGWSESPFEEKQDE